MAPTPLSVAVCLFPIVCPTDFQGPIELLSFISPDSLTRFASLIPSEPAYSAEVTYLGVTKDAVQGSSGPLLLPTKAYSDVKDDEQFDIVLVPGGLGTRPGVLPQAVVDFVKKQAPGAKYVLSVCTGSEVLAVAGVLNGLRATTNKSLFTTISSDYSDKGITWVPKARWVVDGKVWTASGVTAGADMGYAFLKHLVGLPIAETVRGIIELAVHEEDDDEFASFYKLI